jgi:hypothetical protein
MAAVLTTLCGVLGSREAQALDGYILPGPYVGYRARYGGAVAYGAELSVHFWKGKDLGCCGAALQVGRVEGARPYTRTAAVGQVTPFRGILESTGVELGVAQQWFDRGGAGHAVAIAPFFSLGVLALSVRLDVPLNSVAQQVGTEVTFLVTAKWPFRFGHPGPRVLR